MAEDTQIGSGTSSTTRSAKNLPLNMAENAEIGGNDDGGDDAMVEKSLLFKKPNRPIGYLISLRSGKRWVSFNNFGHCWGF